MNPPVLGICLLLLFHGYDAPGMTEADRESTSCSGYIKILGSTNLNSFELAYSFGTDQVLYPAAVKGTSAPPGVLNIPVKDFQGRSTMMERDFYTLVKSDRYPEITIRFHGFKGPVSETGKNIMRVDITMAGINRQYDVLCESSTNITGGLCLKGSKTIEISDFRLKPPEKLFGIVKMDTYIDVDFSVNFITGRETNLLYKR